MKQLTQLVKPFPAKYIKDNQGRGSYVSHDVVTQKLLGVVGPFDFEVREVLRGDTKDGKCVNVVVGVVCRLTLEVDGRRVSVEDVGDCEIPSNWPHDGARMKDAVSDAIKRCAMRIGVGLHLWSGQEFFLYERLAKEDDPVARGEAAATAALTPPDDAEVPAVPPSRALQEARERLRGKGGDAA